MNDKKKLVRENYGKIASNENSCACQSSCCSNDEVNNISKQVGYSENDMQSVPKGSNLGLGCGNPLAFAEIKDGDTVLDLGSGAGIDCFLASSKVGDSGKVIGVDMTPEMIQRARIISEVENYNNVEFRLGEIEDLPVDDSSVDLIISNCVINLSPDKKQVFAEISRVLKNNGKVLISDIVLLKPLPESILESNKAYTACISGALLKDEYIGLMKQAGLANIQVIEENVYPVDCFTNVELQNSLNNKDSEDIGKSIVSIKISAMNSIDEFGK
ncbi:MAG: arsenite methyltransferase [Planctomycetes bacterium]|nr:arsenite methyltransferase [Planctomycetota bacterium]